jgi:hypothetical protein
LALLRYVKAAARSLKMALVSICCETIALQRRGGAGGVRRSRRRDDVRMTRAGCWLHPAPGQLPGDWQTKPF